MLFISFHLNLNNLNLKDINIFRYIRYYNHKNSWRKFKNPKTNESTIMGNYEEPEKEDIFLENKNEIMKHIDKIHNASNIKTVIDFLKKIENDEFSYETTRYISKTGISEEVTWDERLIAYVIEFWDRKILVNKLNQEKTLE